MPVYEFACNACGAAVSVFTRSINAPLEPKCDRCGSADLRRLISHVAVLRSGDFDEGVEPDPNDPKAMLAWAKHLQQEMGDAGGPEMADMVQRLERGESLGDDFMPDSHDYGDEF